MAFVVALALFTVRGDDALWLSNETSTAHITLADLPSSEEAVGLGISMSGVPFCGAWVVVSYDADAVTLKDVVPASALIERGGVLSFADLGSEIAIIVDFSGNYTDGAICEMLFEAIETASGRDAHFEMRVEALYAWNDDGLTEMNLSHKSEISVVIPPENNEDGVFYPSASTEIRDETVDLILSATAPERAFAAGFEVLVVELSNFESQCFSVTMVLGGDMAERRSFSCRVSLSSKERYCVVVKPLAYLGNSVSVGRETVIIVDNGGVRH